MLRVVDEAARSDTGRQRHANEDSYLARAPMFVVADGMGGAQAGEVASRIAAESFEGGVGAGVPEQEIARIAQTANARIFELARSDASRAGMGTTLTGALVSGDEVSIVHVGDSRAYLLRDGRLRRLTRDHSLVEELRRRGQLTAEEAEEHPQRSIITRALGPEPEVDLDLATHQARSGDVFLLCSDGLTGMVDEGRIREILVTTPDLGRAAERLIRAANEEGGRDNITVVAFRLEGDEPAAAGEQDLGETITDLHARDLPLPAEGAEVAAAAGGGGTVGVPPARAAEPPTVEPPAAGPEPATPTASAPRRRRRRLRAATVALVVIVLLAGLVVGARAGLQEVYFVGQEGGLVTLYRGLPYEMPFGIDLYTSRYVSPVPVRSLSPVERRRVLDHQLRSREDAAGLIRRLERDAAS